MSRVHLVAPDLFKVGRVHLCRELEDDLVERLLCFDVEPVDLPTELDFELFVRLELVEDTFDGLLLSKRVILVC